MNNPYYESYWAEKEDTLEHFGILGMKWGIRRFQNKDGTLTSAGKKRYSVPPSVKKDAVPTSIKGQPYNKDIRFPPGTVGYRVQGSKDFKSDGPIYLTFDKSDHVKYLDLALNHPDYGVAVDSQTLGEPIKSVYSLELKTKEEIKAPSYQHAMETFVEMVGDIGIDKINPDSKECLSGKWFIESISNTTVEDLGPDYAYKRFVDTMRKPNRTAFYNDFTNRLAKKGYNALVDPEDRGYESDGPDSSYGFEAPIILLDKKAIKVSNVNTIDSSKFREMELEDLRKKGGV